jgi:hypothetical protein
MEYQNPGVRWRDNCGAVSAGHVLIGSSAKVLGTTLQETCRDLLGVSSSSRVRLVLRSIPGPLTLGEAQE